MQKTNILRGTWSKNGNFTGKNISGERIYVSKSLMAELGYKTGDDARGFSCAYITNLIGQLDENGEPKVDSVTGELVRVPRVEATAIFATAEEMHQAFADEASHDIAIKTRIQASAKSAGLTEKAVESLLSVAI